MTPNDTLLRAYLEARPTPCTRCGFDLRDLPSARCPECGEPLELVVRGTRPRLLPAAGTVLLSMGTGASLVVVAASIGQTMMQAVGQGRIRVTLDFDTVHAGIAGFALAAFAPTLAAWLAPPGRLMTRSPATQLFVVCGAGTALVALMVALTLAG